MAGEALKPMVGFQRPPQHEIGSGPCPGYMDKGSGADAFINLTNI